MIKSKNQPLIKLVDVYKKYKMGNEIVKALDGINLNIYSGEFILILGPSGSGKTTLLNQIGGIDKPDKGSVYIGDTDIVKLSDKELTKYRAKTIGWVFQFFNLIPSLTAIENVMLGLELSGQTKEMKKRAERLLKDVGLEDKLNYFPAQLSGGQQQRIALCRALVKKPLAIIADEPTGNLDHRTSMEMIKLMKELNEKEHVTFVVVSHDESLKQVADRVLHLVNGKIVADQQGKHSK